MIVELNSLNNENLYIFTAHISAIITNAPEKGTQIFIDDSETPFYVIEDVETVLRKIRESMVQTSKEG